MTSAELHALLTARLSAARSGEGSAVGPTSDRELFRRLPGDALNRIVDVEIDEIARRADDLLFKIEGGGGPLGRIRTSLKRAVRRLGLHYLMRQTEMNQRLARSVAALQSVLAKTVVELERGGRSHLTRLVEIEGSLERRTTALTERVVALAELGQRSTLASDARFARIEERLARNADALAAIRGAATQVALRLDVTERRVTDDLRVRDQWLRSLEDQLRAVLEDVRAQIRERDGWIDSTQRTVGDALAELREFAAARDEWFKSLEASVRTQQAEAARRDQWLERVEAALGNLRGDTERGLESRDQWLRALERSLAQISPLGGRGATGLGSVAETPEDTWLIAVRSTGSPTVEPLAATVEGAARAGQRSAPPTIGPAADRSRIETVHALLTDVAELRPRAKVFGELEPLRERLAARRRVIDVGCGDGHALAYLRELGVEASGVDLDERAVSACRAEGLAAVHADAVEYLGRESSALGADTILCLHLIEHLEVDPALELLAAFASALPPGGLLILATPNPESLTTQLVHFWRDLGHVRPYPRIILERILTRLGFAVEPPSSSARAVPA